MSAKILHRWLGLLGGVLAVILALSGVLLAVDPVQQAWQAAPIPADLSVAELAQRVTSKTSGVEQIRRLPSGVLVVYSFDGEQAHASRIDPQDGSVLGPYQRSALPRWVKNLHRALLLGDSGRWGAAATALLILVLSISGLILMLRRMGGWRSMMTARVPGSLAQRLHVWAGRAALPVLLLSSVTALYMSATTLGLVELGSNTEPDVASMENTSAAVAERTKLTELPALQASEVRSLRKLNFPAEDDATDTWEITTDQGTGWIDRHSGALLTWEDATFAQRAYDWALLLHAGELAWLWALLLALATASIPLFWLTGVIIWWQGRSARPRVAHQSTPDRAEMLIFVASEGGSTWGFVQALHEALHQAGHAVHTAALEQFQITPAARQVFILAAAYGDGDAPAHASRALERIAAQPVGEAGVPVTVLGFGDRQFPAFCAFAEALDRQLRAQGWPQLLALERIHQQSAQAFALWGQRLAEALGEPLNIEYRPKTPKTTALRLLSRQDFSGSRDGATPAVILRFALPSCYSDWHFSWHFVAGDLIGILPPGAQVPRFYSLASGRRDGFVEICVRKLEGGLCSGFLHGLQPGETVQAFLRPNPGFVLEGENISAGVVLIGAGTGVAPLAGFIRGNRAREPMYLYFGARHPEQDFYFQEEIQHWLKEGRLADLRTAFSRLPDQPDGAGYVQDALRQDQERLHKLLAAGAQVRICGSRAMAQAVAQVLDGILAPLKLNVAQLKTEGRYAEDVF